MNTLQLFGKRIKELRKYNRITQEKLAEMIGIEPQQVCRIEKGVCFTTIETLEKLSKVLNVDMEELFKFSHLKLKSDLTVEINAMIEKANDKEIQLIYRLIKYILAG